MSEMTPWKSPPSSNRKASAPDSVGTTAYPWPSRTARTNAITAGSSSIRSTGALADLVPVLFPDLVPDLVSDWVILDALLQLLQRMPSRPPPGDGRQRSLLQSPGCSDTQFRRHVRGRCHSKYSGPNQYPCQRPWW